MPTPQRIADFRSLEFGMFIHYNMATYHDAQWVKGYPSPSTFDPGVDTIDTDAWADAAATAGMQYAVLTTKHVAGFCLWKSKLTSYSVAHHDCPYQHDVVEQFVESFTSRGLKVGLYYCWHFPAIDDPYKVLPPECDPSTHDIAEQIEFQQKHIAELVQMFPQCFYLWNDGLDTEIMPAEQARAFFDRLNPQMVVSGNWADWAKKGEPYLDVCIKECRDFSEGFQGPGETCWYLENGWFWQPGITTNPTDEILSHMQTALSRNSNFLLNVGPDRQGRILDTSAQALKQIGQWYKSDRTE